MRRIADLHVITGDDECVAHTQACHAEKIALKRNPIAVAAPERRHDIEARVTEVSGRGDVAHVDVRAGVVGDGDDIRDTGDHPGRIHEFRCAGAVCAVHLGDDRESSAVESLLQTAFRRAADRSLLDGK